MPINYTHLYSGTDASITSGSHTLDASLGTVASGTYLIFAVFATKAGSQSSGIHTAVKLSGTGSIDPITTLDNTGSSQVDYAVLSLFATSVTSSGTVTMRFSNSSTNTYSIGATVIGITGHDSSNPVVGLVKNNESTADGPISLTLTEAPLVGDLAIGFVNLDADAGNGKGVDAGSGFTEVVEVGGSSDYVMAQAQVRTGSTSTTVSWTDVRPTGAPFTYSTAAGALIIKAASGKSMTGIASVTGISSITL